MTPRPIHKWKTFWLGILILAFLGWAWIHSLTFASGFFSYTVKMGDHGVLKGLTIAANQEGGIISLTTLPYPYSQFSGFTYWSHASVPAGHPLFPTAVTTGEHHSTISHWFLILLFLIPWLAFLAWRWRRMKHPLDC
jgi:hypothetical protein